MIEVRNIKKSFGDKVVIEDVSAVMKAGQCNLIIGTSGSGKTVLMKCMVGLFEPDEGEILYSGENFTNMSRNEKTEIRKQIGMLFQGGALFDSKNVEQNVMFPLDILTTMPPKDKIDRVNFCLARVGLENVNKKMPSEISGGMKKRVGIARAIVTDPTLIVADEPTGDLDSKSADEILTMMEVLAKEIGKTIIMVTHDPKAAGRAQRVLHLEKGKLVLDTAAPALVH